MSWITQRTPQESLEIMRDMSLGCAKLGGPISSALYMLVSKGFYREVIDYSIDYETIDVTDAIYARQIQAFFAKCEFLPLGIDREKASFELFMRAEAKCRETNTRLRLGRSLNSERIESIMFIAQRKISRILGDVPEFSDFNFAFGPGAATNVNGQRACPRVKLGVDLVCSANFAPVAGDLLAEVPHWTALHCDFESEDSYRVNISVSPGKLVFVPKNAKIFRSIVVEPNLNGFFQKGVGSYIKERLLRFGLDLYDQQHNRDLAYEGSVSGKLATVDLSMASDCLAINLVRDLLPVDWVHLLDGLRTPSVLFRNQHIQLEKFSSMGNGYTFELESLIFYTISLAVCEQLQIATEQVSVFGDDIIVPTAAYETLVEVLEFCGFSVNLDKSFSSGPFRESCGADYLHGIAIRPFYLKTRLSDQVLFVMHNWLLRQGEYELAERAKLHTHPAYRIYGPDGYGDGHLVGTHTLRYPRSARRRQWGGGFFDTYILKQISYSDVCPGDAVLPVYSVYVRSGAHDPTDPDVVRGSKGYAKVAVYTLATTIFRSSV